MGLATPLLDWTTSPFVAAYFAFAEEDEDDQSDSRVVFALSKTIPLKKSKEIAAAVETGGVAPIIEFHRPDSNENPRLLSQGGLFTRLHSSDGIEAWLSEHMPEDLDKKILFRILIPNSERRRCLRALNRMNINPMSLFPDLYGASKYCNLALRIERY